ncbi:unnamed protein product [Caenorhabditis brenneri]
MDVVAKGRELLQLTLNNDDCIIIVQPLTKADITTNPPECSRSSAHLLFEYENDSCYKDYQYQVDKMETTAGAAGERQSHQTKMKNTDVELAAFVLKNSSQRSKIVEQQDERFFSCTSKFSMLDRIKRRSTEMCDEIP